MSKPTTVEEFLTQVFALLDESEDTLSLEDQQEFLEELNAEVSNRCDDVQDQLDSDEGDEDEDEDEDE